MVTRAQSGSLGQVLTKQLFHHPKVLMMAASCVLILSAIPGMPFLVMGPIGTLLFIYAFAKFKRKEKKEAKVQERTILFAPPLEIQLGIHAVSFAEPLQEKMIEIRKKVAAHLGFTVPKVKISDNVELPLNGWKILIRGWVALSGREANIQELSHLLQGAIVEHAHELICRQDVLHLIQEVKNIDSAIIEELIPSKLSVGHLLKVLQNLLKEKIPIKDMVTILEILADHVGNDKNVDLEKLTEKVRTGLAKGISETFFGKAKRAHVITLDPKVEQIFDVTEGKLRPKVLDQLTQELLNKINESARKGIQAVIVTSADSRIHVRKCLEGPLPSLPVLSYREITADVEIHKIGHISNEILI